MGILQAKRVIALTWKNIGKPSITQRFKEVSLCLPLEKITCTLKDKQEIFQKIWGCYIQYIKNKDLSDLLCETGTA